MKYWIKQLKNIERDHLLFAVIMLVLNFCTVVLLRQYFSLYNQPYMMKEIEDLSKGWRYKVVRPNEQEVNRRSEEMFTLTSLRSGPLLDGGDTLLLYRTLDTEIQDAAVLIRANHQTVNVFIDEEPLYTDRFVPLGTNPGMSLHFLLLPDNYLHKTLRIELVSPYDLYAGRTGLILMGSIPSLEAYAISHSIRPVIMMSMCMLLGLCTIALTIAQALRGIMRPQNLAIGLFAIIWALYYVCTEYIAFLFFSPIMMSVLSLSFYFAFQAPLSLFFYFSFERYKKWMLPAVILHCGFPAIALLLQIFGVTDLPRLVSLNNVLLTGFIYTILLAILEACETNRMMRLAAPFMLMSYISMLYNFSVFYQRHGVVPYSYRDTYFLLILCVLVYNVWQFFSDYHRTIREGIILTLQNRTAIENYEQIKAHLYQVGGIKHEIKHHLRAVQAFLRKERYTEAMRYLERCAEQTEEITEAIYHDNLLINTVVYKLDYAAKHHGIQVELDLNAEPFRIADPDLFSILANIVDNALESCASMPADTSRLIRLRISRREPYLNIFCENSRAGEIVMSDGQIQTTKQDSGHGYGLGTISHIVDCYDGVMDIDYDENMFTIMVALKDV